MSKARSSRKTTTVFAALGTTLDAGQGAPRWERWRPTIALFQHDDLLIDRLELLYDPRFQPLAQTVKNDIAQISPETEIALRPTPIPDPWDFERVYAMLLDWVRDRSFDPEKEDYLVHITTGTHVMQICFFLLVESRHIPGALIQTSPPSKREGRLGRYDIIDLDLEKYDLLRTRFEQERAESLSFLKAGIETRNARFNRMIEEIEHVASRTRDPILLMGPTGAGKSQLARRIYELKKRSQPSLGPWVEVNCATLRGDAAMSTLFGHTRGAFTGAQRDRSGLLRMADRGVLFLDEIGELGVDEQAMLLHAVEDKRFLPMGADAPITVDFQLLVGTNRDLREQAAANEFREDLLARIDVWTFVLPSLAERPEDIEPNLDVELERASERAGRVLSMNADARKAFLRFAKSREARWAGNFRDLSAAVLRMSTLAPGGRIDVATVKDEIARLESAWSAYRENNGMGGEDRVARVLGEHAAELDRFDRVQLEDVLRVCEESRSLSEAGRTLFASSRARRTSANDADRLRKYLARFGLSFSDITANGEHSRALSE
jgi:transcriptional regulatory protein RtcR